MKNNLDLKQLDILTFAKNASALSGEYDLASFTRLRQEDVRESTNEAVTWSLRGQEI